MRFTLSVTRQFPTHPLWVALLGALTATAFGRAAAGEDVVEERGAGRRVAVIIVGLPGDEEHDEAFQRTSRQWRTWLVERLQFQERDVYCFSGRGEGDGGDCLPATRASIEQRITTLKSSLRKDDVFWAMFLGHANDENRHAFFHLPGPDIDEQGVAELFRDISCTEQVFWMTHACSGHFLKPLSQPHRIVITATVADTEINEAEFPRAFTTITERDSQELDSDKDGRVSVRELFVATVREVESIFQSDSRIPTEHALLDDNGDGRGTELLELAQPELDETGGSSGSDGDVNGDGLLAGRTFLPPPAATGSEKKQTRGP